jgi:hypothetical protein
MKHPILTPIGQMLAVSEREFCPSPVPSRCAWCDKEAGRAPSSVRLESHTICPRHLEQEKARIEQMLKSRPSCRGNNSEPMARGGLTT